jgi:hypothetical protein
MTKYPKIKSRSHNLPTSSDQQSAGLRKPTTLPLTNPESKSPNILGSWTIPKSQSNAGSLSWSLRSQSSGDGTVHGEGHSQESMKPSPLHESWTQSTLLERPLHQATETGGENAFKGPIKRSVDNSMPAPLRGVKAVIAVDISGSTEGKVIEQEINAAQSICSNFLEVSEAQTKIIPWDHRTHTFRTVRDVERLGSRGGGTRPSALTSNIASVNALRKCSAWLLFTDGKIDDHEIRDFSRGLCANGLHGTAGIVVVFGYKYQKPVDCNISVGISIFGMAPDCLFLFHDVSSGVVSILQSKGVFNALLPKVYGALSLDENTEWCELPTINYGDLSRIEIPAPRRLSPGDILLQSNRTVRLNDVYNNTVDAATANELLEVEDNLKTLLLTSEINGQNASVKRWIATQQLKSRDPLYSTRPDVNNAASTYISELLLLSIHTKDLNRKRCLQGKLMNAHKQNWLAFISHTEAERTRISRRAEVVHNALDRVTSNAVESSRGLWTTKMIAPISSWGPEKSGDRLSTVSAMPLAPSPPENYQESTKAPFQSKTPSTFPLSCPVVSACGDSPGYFSPDTDLLFIPGYRYNRSSNSPAVFKGECRLCGDTKAILALLVKKPATGLVSPILQAPNSCTSLEFLLSIGTYPEAKVLSSFVCCDSCAYHLVKMKKSPHGENVIGAIPLILEALSGEYQQTALETLDNALLKKFEKPTLDLVFLSILYCTLMDLNDDGKGIEKMALHWAASMLSSSISMPSILNTTFNTGQLSIERKVPLRQSLSDSLDAISKPSPTLLQYPLGGFVVVIQCMIDLGLDSSTVRLKNAVFQRILYHIVEKYHESLTVNGREATIKGFYNLTWSHELQGEVAETLGSASLDNTFDIISVPRFSIPTSSLTDIQLLSVRDADLLQKLGPWFEHVKDKFSFALAVFLHILCKEAAADSRPMEIFDAIRAKEAFRLVFKAPDCIGETEAKELIRSICFGTLGATKSEMLPRTADGGVAAHCKEVEPLDFDMISEESYGGAW